MTSPSPGLVKPLASVKQNPVTIAGKQSYGTSSQR